MKPHYRHYLVGFILSLLFSVTAFFAINQIDSGQIAGLAKQVELDALESESARLSLLFIESLESGSRKKDSACLALIERASQQVNQTYGILTAIETTKKTVFLGDVRVLQQKYFLSNAALYLDFKKINEFCGQDSELVLFFYRSETPCPACDVQGKVLDELRAECPTVKTFAFPIDSHLPLVELFKKTFGVKSAPHIIINEEKSFDRLVSKTELKQEVSCR